MKKKQTRKTSNRKPRVRRTRNPRQLQYSVAKFWKDMDNLGYGAESYERTTIDSWIKCVKYFLANAWYERKDLLKLLSKLHNKVSNDAQNEIFDEIVESGY